MRPTSFSAPAVKEVGLIPAALPLQHLSKYFNPSYKNGFSWKPNNEVFSQFPIPPPKRDMLK